MANSANTFLFIPDISGFTEFVNSTELDHSKHIISELLEIIINNDTLGLTISEIEGDAVLFYKKEIPPVEKIISQAEKMFVAFHNHLKRYETDRICRCGACRTASGLSLKFIAHAGDIQFIEVKEFKKLHGADNILVHKLLKNSIPEHEYLLLSDSFDINANDAKLVKDFSWAQFEGGKTNYKNVGEITYKYISLNPLHKMVTEWKVSDLPKWSATRIQLTTIIDAPVDVVYENITNLEIRQLWNKNIREIKRNDNKLLKVGTKHGCIVNAGELEIEALGRKENKNEIVFGEHFDAFNGLSNVNRFFRLKGHGNHVHLNFEIDFKLDWKIAKIFRPVWILMLKWQSKKELGMLKKYSESNRS